MMSCSRIDADQCYVLYRLSHFRHATDETSGSINQHPSTAAHHAADQSSTQEVYAVVNMDLRD